MAFNTTFGPTSASPVIITPLTWAALASTSSITVDLQGADRASLQANFTVTSAGTSTLTCKISNDNANWTALAGGTITLTGTNATGFLRLGALDYRYLQISTSTPSAGALTGSVIMYLAPNYVLTNN